MDKASRPACGSDSEKRPNLCFPAPELIHVDQRVGFSASKHLTAAIGKGLVDRVLRLEAASNVIVEAEAEKL